MKTRSGICALLLGALFVFEVQAVTTGTVPSDGVYKFTFGVESTDDDSFAVPASAIYDAATDYSKVGDGTTFTYGFLGTTENSYKTDNPWSLSSVPTAIDGMKVVQGQYIVLHDVDGIGVKGPTKEEYMPAGASDYEGRYPIRFSFSAEQGAYYAVTCTVANASTTANADVTLFSERCHIQAHHLTLAPGATRTFAWSVELFPNVYKSSGTYTDDAINIVVVGENAALKSVVAVKQPQQTGKILGVDTEKMNVGKTMWLCDDSTGTDQNNATPFFSLQNYSGVGSGLSRYAPANLAIRNQGEGGLATNDKAHFESCMLKPGDYLYVEYGHNESGTTSYTNNLEKYYTAATNAQAKLIIVSAVERRNKWDSETSTWGRSLQVYAEAGEAWVEDKIANGSTCVAFIDLNKTYTTWMNQELQRIHNVNSAVSLNAAISYYYRSAKGANVDNTHINNAGTDQAAYWVWYDALARVAAGEAEDATDSQKIQAAVLKGITEGYQAYAGIDDTTVANTPWSVTDEIINAGAAPNSYWDTPVTSGYDYVNDAVIADVDAVANDDGTVTISGATMRILNPGNYYKIVYDIISADGATTNRCYSYSNYDVGGAGKVSGDLVTPEKTGFVSNDVDKATIEAADCATLTIPAGGKAYAWVAVADAGTWQVGTNANCSAKYPIEWWSDVIIDNDCATADDWTILSQAVTSKSVVDGAIYFTTTGADSSNTKKNFVIYKTLDQDMGAGRYRISFKAMIEAGDLNFKLCDSVGTTSSPFPSATSLFEMFTTSVIGYGSTSPLITVDADAEGNPVPQAKPNVSRWVDVDLILDRDNARAWISAGGSEYVEYEDAAFLPGSFSGRTWKYFGITCPSQTSSYGYVDEVKIVKLSSVTYPTVTATAAPSDATMGEITINGYATNSLTVFAGRDFMIKAAPTDYNRYKFSGWSNGATAANLFIENCTANVNLTASFEAYGHDDTRTLAWDFSDYQGDFEVSGSAQTITNNGLEFHLTADDALTSEGLIWDNSANSGTSDNLAYAKYIVFTPAASGTITIKFSVSNTANSRTPKMIIKAANSTSECSSSGAVATKEISAINTETTITASLTGGTTYYIWPYSYNWSGGKMYHTWTIPSITYDYAPVYCTATASVSGMGKAEIVGESAVFAGDSVTFKATPATGAYKFTGWTDSEGESVTTANPYTVALTADLALTAHFAALEEGEAYTASVDFANMTAVSATATTVITNGAFVYHLASGDSLSSDGVYFSKNSIKTSGSSVSGRYIEFTAPQSGTVEIVFQAGAVEISSTKNVRPYLMENTGDTMTSDNADSSVQVDAANTDKTLSFEVEKGVTYNIYSYYYNRETWIKLTSINYPGAADLVTLTLAASPTDGGTLTVNGAEVTGAVNALQGETVSLAATAAAGKYEFTKWSDDSTDNPRTVMVSEATALTAVFSKIYTALDVASGETETRTAALTGESNYKKTGAGTLTLVGNNTFTGDLLVSEGTLKIATPYDAVGTMLARFDTTVASTISYTNEIFESIADVNGGSVSLNLGSSTNAPAVAAVEGVLGGNTVIGSSAFRLYSSAAYASKPETIYMVWNPVVNGKYLTAIATDTNKYNVQRHNTLTGQYESNVNGTYSGGNIYVNGSTAVVQTGDQVVCVNTNSWIRYSSTKLYFGSADNCYIGEVILYSTRLDDNQRSVMDEYLMAKWGIGDGTYTLFPTNASLSVASGATLDLGEFTGDYVITASGFAIESGATIKLDALPADGVILKLALGTEGVTNEVSGITVNVNGADLAAEYKVVISGGEVQLVRGPASYSWNGAAGADWSDAGNWLYGDEVPETAPVMGTDKIVFPGEATVAIDDLYILNNTSNLDVKGFVTFKVNETETLNSGEVKIDVDVGIIGDFNLKTNFTGSGKLTLKGCSFLQEGSRTGTFSNPLEIAEGTTATFTMTSANTGRFKFDGPITGSGRIVSSSDAKAYAGLQFNGDMSGFTGVADISVGSTSDLNRFMGAATNMSASAWNIFTNGTAGANSPLFYSAANVTYSFGALNAVIPSNSNESNYKNCWIEIGALDENCVLAGSFNSLNNKESIRWIASSATLDLSTKNVYSLEVTGGGTVKLAADATNTIVTVTNGSVVVPVGSDAAAGDEIFVFKSGSSVGADQIGLSSRAFDAVVSTNEAGVISVALAEREGGELVPMFITGGQSNTDGRLDGTSAGQELPSYLAGGNANALVSATTGYSASCGTFVEWGPCTGASGQPTKWAYDAVTYYLLGEALGKFYVAKTSYGGTSINPSVSNSPSGTHSWLADYGSGYHWSADSVFLAATDEAGKSFTGTDGETYEGQSLLLAWIANIDASIDAIKAAGNTPDIKAILWHQGESDRTVASTYKENLLAMIAYVRNHLVEKTGNSAYANLPFFCGTIPHASTQGSSTIDRAFLELDEDETNNIFAVDIYDITLKSDNIHFSAEGAEIFGRRLYNRLVDEGVVEGEKVDEPYAVRKPDFGVEHVINNTTTWTFNEYSKNDVIAGTLTDVKGMYLHGENSTTRGFVAYSANKSLEFSIGDTNAVAISIAPYTAGRGYGSNTTALTSAGNAGSSYYTTAAVNVGRAGSFETLLYPAKDGATLQLYFNGKVVDEVTNVTASTMYSLKGTNDVAGAYYISLSGYIYLMGARFVPETEMEAVTITVPESGVATFGDIYGVTFVLPDGMRAFTADIDSGDASRVNLTEVTSLNRGTAVIVSAAPGEYTLSPAAGTAYSGDNLMVAQTADGTVEAVAGEDFVNFLVSGSGTAVTFTKSDEKTVVKAGEAYLSVSSGSASAALSTLTATIATVITPAGDSSLSAEVAAADADTAAEAVTIALSDDVASAIAEAGGTAPDAETYAEYFTKTAAAKAGSEGVFIVTVALDESAVEPEKTLLTVDSSALAAAEEGDAIELGNAKVGLYYSLVGGTALDQIATEGDRTLATSQTVSPKKPELGDSSAKFYRVKVSARAQE